MRERQRDRGRKRDRQTDRQREAEKERETDRERQRETEIENGAGLVGSARPTFLSHFPRVRFRGTFMARLYNSSFL